LTQLAARLASHSGNWNIQFALESPATGRIECSFGRGYGKQHYLHLREGTRERSLSPKDAETGLLDLAVLLAGAVPRSGLKIKPASLGKGLEVLAIQTLAEVFGQPIPAAQDMAKAKKAARKKSSSERDALIAELRSGVITAWNNRSPAERKTLGDFKKADLSHCQLAGLLLEEVNCSGANFEGANLTGANVIRTNFQKANLRSANLAAVIASRVKMQEANLEGAQLQRATLSYANLKGANLKSADLTGATLTAANLCGADLTGAILTGAGFDIAEFDAATKFPAGFDPRTAGLTWRGTTPLPAPAVSAPPKENLDFTAFYERVRKIVDGGRLGQAVSMLKGTKFHLFAEVNENQVIGVTRSQGSKDRFYACRLTSAGQYECGTQRLNKCAVLGGRVCKHLLVLILGLARSGTFDCGLAFQWLQLTRGQKETMDREVMTATFLKYKGVESGEVDWRPTETIPEDYYAL
jgi:hypothetical protein